MESKLKLLLILQCLVIIGLVAGIVVYLNIDSVEPEKEIIRIDANTELELRLQAEIDSNQKLAEIIQNIINACNEKLLDKFNNTNEKLEKENEILQKALSKIRGI